MADPSGHRIIEDPAIVERLRRTLAPVPGLHARLNALVLRDSAPGSAWALDGAQPIGELVGVFAVRNITAGLDHLIAWNALLEAGVMPGSAPMTLLRSALEGAATTRWLLDPTADQAERIRRAAASQLEDHRLRRAFERGIGVADDAYTGEAKSGALRHADLLAAMKAAGMATIVPSATDLVNDFGGGAALYQMASAFAHRRQWAVGMSSIKHVEPGEAEHEVRLLLTANGRYVLAITIKTMEIVAMAVAEVEAYKDGVPA